MTPYENKNNLAGVFDGLIYKTCNTSYLSIKQIWQELVNWLLLVNYFIKYSAQWGYRHFTIGKLLYVQTIHEPVAYLLIIYTLSVISIMYWLLSTLDTFEIEKSDVIPDTEVEPTTQTISFRLNIDENKFVNNEHYEDIINLYLD